MLFKSLTALAALFATSLASQAVTLDCTMKVNSNNGGYLTERYILQHDEGAGQAVVSDGLILYYNKQPVTAKVSEDSTKKLVLTWDLILTNDTGQNTRMLFRASYFKADGKVIVRGVPSGYSNSFESRGKCKSV
jgi:hypothetical protein